MTVEWHGEAAKEHVRARSLRVLHRAAVTVARRAKELLSVSGTGVKKGGAVVRAVKATTKRVYGAFPSAPGEPPHKQTGRLRASVTYEIDEGETTARVGTNVEYGRFLELGSKRGLAPRPWLRRALAETAAKIGALLSGLGE